MSGPTRTSWWRAWLEPDGMSTPPAPSKDTDAFGVVTHYVEFYEREYARLRKVSKLGVRKVTTRIAVFNAGIAILGAASAAWKSPWFGLFSTALAALTGVVAARSSIFRDQDLWMLRSSTLFHLQQLKREMEYRKAAKEDASELSADILEKLNKLLEEDLEKWSTIDRPKIDIPEARQ